MRALDIFGISYSTTIPSHLATLTLTLLCDYEKPFIGMKRSETFAYKSRRVSIFENFLGPPKNATQQHGFVRRNVKVIHQDISNLCN